MNMPCDLHAMCDAVAASLLKQGLVQIETSARHVHLSRAHFELLFGAEMQMLAKRPLSQPGQFLSEQRVNLHGPGGTISNVAILGPERKATQCELSLTDAHALGVKPPIRESGDLKGAVQLRVEGPKAALDIAGCAIIAKRHIHIKPEQAACLGLRDQQIVCVRALSDRPVLFEDVVVRVSESFAFRMHVDIDEANAAHLSGYTLGEIIR